MDLDRLFEQGCHHFDTGDFFEAHEVWEDLWNELSGPRRSFIQGLIQIAVALHHGGNGNFGGMRKLFASSFNHLEAGKSDSAPIDVESLKDRVLDVEEAVRKGEAIQPFPLPYQKDPVK